MILELLIAIAIVAGAYFVWKMHQPPEKDVVVVKEVATPLYGTGGYLFDPWGYDYGTYLPLRASRWSGHRLGRNVHHHR